MKRISDQYGIHWKNSNIQTIFIQYQYLNGNILNVNEYLVNIGHLLENI